MAPFKLGLQNGVIKEGALVAQLLTESAAQIKDAADVEFKELWRSNDAANLHEKLPQPQPQPQPHQEIAQQSGEQQPLEEQEQAREESSTIAQLQQRHERFEQVLKEVSCICLHFGSCGCCALFHASQACPKSHPMRLWQRHVQM